VSNLDLRPLSLGELLDRCFTLYRRHFLLFVGIVAFPYMLMLAMQLVQIFVFFPANFPTEGPPVAGQAPFSTPSTGAVASVMVFYVVLIVVMVIAYLLAQGGTVFAVSELYLGRPTTIRGSFRKMRGKMLILFALVILNILLVGACTAVAVVPAVILIPVAAQAGGTGATVLLVVLILLLFAFAAAVAIYLACRLMVAIPAALLEDAGPVTALQRSFFLTKKNAGRAFLVLLISFAINFAVISVLMIPPYIGMLISVMNHRYGMIRIWMALFQVGSFIGQALAGPILIIATAVFYFDLRVRKEALDLQMMMPPAGYPAPLSGEPPTLIS